MIRSGTLALLAALACAPPAAAQRSLAIERFDATIRVHEDAGIEVTETITVRFTGSWNGIYRNIPVKYRTAQGLNWTLGLDVQGATDREGRALRIEKSRQRHYLHLRIWIPGAQDATHTVALRYRATNALRFFEDHDELYWNVTGDEWDVPIEAAAARIELPPDAAGVRAIAFNGVHGSRAQDAEVEIEDTTVRVAMPHALGFREGLTAVVGWDKGAVTPPPAVARAAGFLASNWPLLLPVPVFVAALIVWWRRGKDPQPRPVAVQYEPPPDLTPAEAGALLDNKVNLRDVTATLVNLAVRGHLRFEEREDTRFLGLLTKREYVMHRLNPPEAADALAPHERLVLDGVFGGRGTTVELSELENEFYRVLPKIRSSVFERLHQHGLYSARPDKMRTIWTFGAVAVGGAVAFGGGALADRFLLTPVPFVGAGVLIGIILLAFGRIMPARTVKGARALEKVLGFEEFQRRVNSEEFKRVIVGRPELFDQYLPFAMAFGVEKKWARAFEGIYREPPRWYTGADGSGPSGFSVSRLSDSLSGFSSRAGETLGSAPRSSSGSGFGGGGSSGGGGGGGGGGGF